MHSSGVLLSYLLPEGVELFDPLLSLLERLLDFRRELAPGRPLRRELAALADRKFEVLRAPPAAPAPATADAGGGAGGGGGAPSDASLPGGSSVDGSREVCSLGCSQTSSNLSSSATVMPSWPWALL